MVETKGKMKKYCTDGITNVMCNYFNSDLNNIDTVKLLAKFTKNELAEYILDSFNRCSLSSASIQSIPEQG